MHRLTRLVLFGVTFIACISQVQAQTFRVLYNFSDSTVGVFPKAGLTMDRAGNLYGTTSQSGPRGFGGVFKLMRAGTSDWIFVPLYAFTGGSDGGYPTARVVFGPDGTLFGTAPVGGTGTGCYGGPCGVVFNLRPGPCTNGRCPWIQKVIHAFAGGSEDGSFPHTEVVFDSAGNLYGTTLSGGPSDLGTVYELTPSPSGWTEKVLYSFGGDSGGSPMSEVILDGAGNLYGTTNYSFGFNYGTAFKLMRSGSSWVENTLYSFSGENDGSQPAGGLTFDSAGNLYGTTPFAGVDGGGTAFQLSPSGGGWNFNVIQSFPGDQQYATGPHATLTLNAGGNLYGTTLGQPYGPDFGTVFELTATSGAWTETVLHSFAGYDGQAPLSNVIFDASGNLYGTASEGGGYGVVWEISR